MLQSQKELQFKPYVFHEQGENLVKMQGHEIINAPSEMIHPIVHNIIRNAILYYIYSPNILVYWSRVENRVKTSR